MPPLSLTAYHQLKAMVRFHGVHAVHDALDEIVREMPAPEGVTIMGVDDFIDAVVPVVKREQGL